MLSKRIEITFKNPMDPNTSMGKLLSFKLNGSEIAHLSLAWSCQLWFGYMVNDVYENVYFPGYFNDYQRQDGKTIFEIHINSQSIIWSQNNFINQFNIKKVLNYDEIEEIVNFKNDAIEKINSNQINIYDIDHYIEAQESIDTDILLTTYKSSVHESNMIKSLIDTYTMDNIKRFIFVNNNTEYFELQKSKNIFDNLSELYKDLFEWIYIENPDNSYVHNRISGLKLGLKYCQSKVVTVIDADILFLNSDWQKTYEIYNQVPNCLGCAMTVDFYDSNFYRESQFVLNRFHPCFFHIKKEYILQKIEEDPMVLNDFKIETIYKNMKFNMIGMHFSKLYAEIKNEKDYNFCILHKNQIVYHDRMSKFSERDFQNSFCIHLEGMSFEEVWTDNHFVFNKYSTIFNDMIRYINLTDMVPNSFGGYINLMINKFQNEFKIEKIYEKEIFIGKKYEGEILNIVNYFKIIKLDNIIYIENEIQNMQKVYSDLGTAKLEIYKYSNDFMFFIFKFEKEYIYLFSRRLFDEFARILAC